MYKARIKFVFLLTALMLFSVLTAGLAFGADTVSISGYIKTDFTSADSSLMSGFKAEVTGTQLSAVTDNSGYFSIAGLSYGQVYNVKISKPGYLARQIENISASGSVLLGSKDAPMVVWAGDMDIYGVQDDSISMSDVMDVAVSFNSTGGSPNYKLNADFDRNDAVNMSDIIILTRHFNKTAYDYPEAVISISTPLPTATRPSPTYTPIPTPTQPAGSSDRYFPAGTSKADLIAKASAMSVSETKALIKKQIDEHWDVLVSICGFKSKESAYAFFFGFATRESTFRSGTETGGGSAHAFGPLQTAETAYANANPDYMPETNVPEMLQYDFKDDTFYDVGISVHMGIRHFLHFARLAQEKHSGKDVLRYGLMGFNTGWVDGSDESWVVKYADEIASLGGWYLYNNHLSDNEFTWDQDPRVDRSNPWKWY